MEVDAFLLLVLSAYVAQTLGAWVLAIGLMRYVFVAVGWFVPWFRMTLPPRYWRKVVTAVQGIALAIAASGLLPGIDIVLVVVALGMLVESFGRDVIWLARSRRGLGQLRFEDERNSTRRVRTRQDPEPARDLVARKRRVGVRDDADDAGVVPGLPFEDPRAHSR
jgi:hypothetical protein